MRATTPAAICRPMQGFPMPDSVAAGLRLAPEERPARSLPSNSPSTPPMTWSPSAACWARSVRSRRCSSVWRCRVRVTTYSSWASRGPDASPSSNATCKPRASASPRLRLGLPEQFRRTARTSGDRAAAGQRDRIQRRHRPPDRQPDVDLPAVFEHPAYQQKKNAVDRAFNQRYDRALDSVERRALEKDVALYRDSANVAFTPMKDGKALDEAEFAQCPKPSASVFQISPPRGVPQRGTGEPAAVEARVEQPVARAQRETITLACLLRLWWRSTTTTRASAPTCRRCN